jgi:hypothetical protein
MAKLVQTQSRAPVVDKSVALKDDTSTTLLTGDAALKADDTKAEGGDSPIAEVVAEDVVVSVDYAELFKASKLGAFLAPRFELMANVVNNPLATHALYTSASNQFGAVINVIEQSDPNEFVKVMDYRYSCNGPVK